MADRCLIYGRVSSERQAEDDKTSLAVQESRCQNACAERGYDVVGVYRGVIPRNLLKRPQLNEVRARVAAGDAGVVMAMSHIATDSSLSNGLKLPIHCSS